MSTVSNFLSEQLVSVSLNAASLVQKYPPRCSNANKKMVFEMSLKTNPNHDGELVFTRWKCFRLPRTLKFETTTELEVLPDIYTYPTPTNSSTYSWHVNFADPHVFGFYGGSLYAQDEMQVTEHPALASLRVMLDSKHDIDNVHFIGATVDRGGPTPVLVRNVERRVVVDTFPRPDFPSGLYGNAFARAPENILRAATTLIEPPTKSNIIAIAAKGHGYGNYSLSDISYTFQTAYSGFLAAKVDSWVAAGKPEDDSSYTVEINTGNWGCGAFGGNPTMMALIQIGAARAAGINKLIYHTVRKSPDVERAFEMWKEIEPQVNNQEVQKLFSVLAGLKLQWGVSNGT